MEIVIAWKKFTQKLMFKIDLIVWKYENKSMHTSRILFKIDLIVWKSLLQIQIFKNLKSLK